MAELAPDDPRLKAAMEALRRVIAGVVAREPDLMTPVAMHNLLEAVKWHRERCKTKHGFDFPHLVPFILPRLNEVKFVRADLDRPSVEQLVINTAREHEAQGITMGEIAWAVRVAFPDFRPHALYAPTTKKELN